MAIFALDVMTVCCSGYATRPIPRSHVKEYFYTSSMCTQPAVIQLLHLVCQDPHTSKWKWRGALTKAHSMSFRKTTIAAILKCGDADT
uniref:Chemokine interleukin-8-like domain-containing protein n=1 Tax=Crocodylus porosus TaxID=8502 RepID=A0A7M4EGN6_CROPO